MPASWAPFWQCGQSEGVYLPLSSSVLFFAFVFRFKTLLLGGPSTDLDEYEYSPVSDIRYQ